MCCVLIIWNSGDFFLCDKWKTYGILMFDSCDEASDVNVIKYKHVGLLGFLTAIIVCSEDEHNISGTESILMFRWKSWESSA